MDPNKTVISGVPPLADPLRTQAMPAGVDPNRTSAMDPSALLGMPGGKALTAEIIASRSVTMANGPAREQFVVEFHAGGAPGAPSAMSGARTPLNLCLVIDRSGSMEGPPLDYVKQA